MTDDPSSSAAIAAAARRRRKLQADLDNATRALGQALLDAVMADDGHMGDHARAAGISRPYAWKLARAAAEASGRPMPRRRSRPNGG